MSTTLLQSAMNDLIEIANILMNADSQSSSLSGSSSSSSSLSDDSSNDSLESVESDDTYEHADGLLEEAALGLIN